ncbi:MAG: hypothetical protein M3Z96_13830 [Pseudomonadota bacterium]|nr:hypothetical protein [Pseudomonadota bacterium]
MQQVRLISVFWLIFGLALAPPAPTAGQEDPFIVLQTNVPGAFSYVRRAEIEALTDVSPSHCVLLLSPGKDVRAFEKCASVLDELQGNNFISFPAEFGNMYVASQRIAELVWTSNSGCHLTLESGKSVDAKQSCNEVHKALLHK